MFLIALGSGGIKPCVAAFVGDQFDQTNKHRAKLVFDAFYWIINFGSFFASLLMPIFLRTYGPSVRVRIPGVLILATVIFWSGRRKYVRVPPAPPTEPSCAWHAPRSLHRPTDRVPPALHSPPSHPARPRPIG